MDKDVTTWLFAQSAGLSNVLSIWIRNPDRQMIAAPWISAIYYVCALGCFAVTADLFIPDRRKAQVELVFL